MAKNSGKLGGFFKGASDSVGGHRSKESLMSTQTVARVIDFTFDFPFVIFDVLDGGKGEIFPLCSLLLLFIIIITQSYS